MAEKRIAQLMASHESLTDWKCGRSHRVSSGFYKSQAMEWLRA
jgi:magnesium-protoporphyrin O-methyltransferase